MLTNTRLRTGTPPRKFYSLILAAVFVGAIFFLYSNYIWQRPTGPNPSEDADRMPSNNPFEPIAKNFSTTLLKGPNLKDKFGELGHRVEVLTSWFVQAQSGIRIENQPTAASNKHNALHLLAENLTLAQFPFLRNPSQPLDPTPVTSLKNTYVTGSRGIVIPVGFKTLRFAIHLIFNIRTVLGTRLPIQVVYAGEDDLPEYSRNKLKAVESDIEFIDILTIFDDSSMGLQDSWAIKPFAALASTFEQVILLDADCMFFQKPEVLFDDLGYRETGALFFHDRKLWQHGFQERHKWWKLQMKGRKPSATLLKSLVWKDDFAEEADSGVVVLDKSRFPLFMGLLHVCWQNTKSVREEVTYKMTYGDKESWWFGLELCGVPYSFEAHYGSVLGGERSKTEVCGFTISHLDQNNRLIWYNGSLLKNKAVDKKQFQIPVMLMYDGDWKKGRTKADMSCMVKGKLRELSNSEMKAIKDTVPLAQKADEEYSLLSF